MIVNPGLRRSFGGIARLTLLVRSIFANAGYNGAIYDPSQISHLNQFSTGTTPVTTVADPVGLVLDSRLGLALGPELVTNGDFSNGTAGWIASAAVDGVGGATISENTGKLRVTNDATGVNYGLGSQAIATVIGKAYRVVLNRGNTSDGLLAYFYVGSSSNGSGAITNLANITQDAAIFVATATTSYINLGARINNANSWAEWDNISVKLLDGNHAIQATAAARPTWQVDANGKYYLSFLGVDDNLTSATGGGGTAGFFWCGVVQPTGGGGIFRVLFDDSGTNVGYLVYLSAANKFVFRAGNGTAYTYAVSSGTVDVGTKYMLTAWDDGINLNVQINNGAISSTARPSVIAGTNGFSLLKTNGAAADYFIGNLYPSVYLKNTAGTAAERAAVQAWVKSKAGL